MALFDLARMTVASSGTGTITLNAAVSGFLTFDLAGCSTAATGQSVTYAIADTAASEIGTGTYTSSALSLTRGPVYSTNANAAINMNATAVVLITPQAKGIVGKINRQVFTANGTYTPTTGMISVDVECLGGGGGGGGVVGSSGSMLGGGGGGSGGYSRSIKLASAIGTSQAVTVGAAGLGSTAATGSAGGQTSVGALVIAPGGNGGLLWDGITGFGTGGLATAAGTGDIAIGGAAGQNGDSLNTLPGPGTIGATFGGQGASANLGGGGQGALSGGPGTVGGTANGYGAGGGGGASGMGASNAAGGNGGSGVVIVTEYCSL